MIIPADWLIVGYRPFSDELDYRTLSFLKDRTVHFYVSQDQATDPYTTAKDLEAQLKDQKVCILIPGRKFDTHGTRHGRGGGWYDRFLSQVPPEWLRVGILKKEQLSEKALTREAWDQPVDWLVVIDGASWQTYETNARK